MLGFDRDFFFLIFCFGSARADRFLDNLKMDFMCFEVEFLFAALCEIICICGRDETDDVSVNLLRCFFCV